MFGKTETNPTYNYRLLHPMHTMLISCVGKDGKPNVTTVSWATPTSHDPPLISISMSAKHHSHKLIQETQEFIVNIPTLEILQAVIACGTFTGRSFDKFKKAGLTPVPGRKVKAPAIRECVGHLECTVEDQFTTGDHTVFVGKIVDAYADAGIFAETYDLKKARLLYHAGGNNFAVLDPKNFKP
jgi:flavin reductase (DIM6/NTAB) family NADH-FMN oxidoreductase RutF